MCWVVELTSHLQSCLSLSTALRVIDSVRARRQWRKWEAGTCQSVGQLAEGYDSSLDMLAIVKMLLRLLVALLEIDFDSDHLVD